jgi:hypothetical protein
MQRRSARERSTAEAGGQHVGTVTTAAAELQAAGEAAGLDAEHVFWILARLVPSLELRRAGYVNGRHRPTLFALRDLLKDLDLALDLFHRSGGAVPMAALVRELVDEAARTAADLDISAVITPRRQQRKARHARADSHDRNSTTIKRLRKTCGWRTCRSGASPRRRPTNPIPA